MVVCWKCGHEYDDDITYCPTCGVINAKSTPTLEADRLKKSEVDSAIHTRMKGVGLLNDSGLIELEIAGERIVIPLETRVILGRDFEGSLDISSIDLARFNALDAGVSCRHAAMQRNADGQVVVIDLGSTNGTYLNYERLQALKAYPLVAGDKIRLGNLSLTLHIDEE